MQFIWTNVVEMWKTRNKYHFFSS